MSTYAKVNNGVVENIVVADSEWVSLQEDSELYIEYSEDKPAYINGPYVDGYFYPEQPRPSWTMDGYGNWVAPEPMPENGQWEWIEDTLSWNEKPDTV